MVLPAIWPHSTATALVKATEVAHLDVESVNSDAHTTFVLLPSVASMIFLKYESSDLSLCAPKKCDVSSFCPCAGGWVFLIHPLHVVASWRGFQLQLLTSGSPEARLLLATPGGYWDQELLEGQPQRSSLVYSVSSSVSATEGFPFLWVLLCRK